MTTVELPRPDVPPAIAVVRDFVNTTDRETGTDELPTAAALVRFLVQEGLLPAATRATSEDLALARRLRLGLRRALEHNHDGAPGPGPQNGAMPPPANPDLTEALRELPVGLDWDGTGPALRSTGAGVPGALARIGLAVHQAASDDQWWRLKICSWDECEWAYYDHSKNRSRAWCEYGCGNKVKTRAYRARQRAQTT